jgi:quercetin dioxygenase-like cupin family protein
VNNADKKRLANQLVGQQNKGRITMKRLTIAFSVAALIASLASARAGDVSVVQNSQGKMPVVIKNDAFSLAPVPAMGEGKPNQGFSYGTAFEMPGSALQIARGHVEPGGKVAAHEGAQQYILYVIRGSGQLKLIGANGQSIGEVSYKPDDVIVFEPHTLHGWVNGDEPFDFLGVDLPVLRK